jgi:hypothetical protein
MELWKIAYRLERGLRFWQLYEWKKRLRDSDARRFEAVARAD